MRRLLVVALTAFLAAPLIGATAGVYVIKPAVVVYPFTATGSSIDREASSRIATILATQMANTGHVSVIPPPPGTERKDYLAAARSHNADYYVAGYISPLGNGVSLVEQVVSATTGIVVYSQSAQINTYAEAAGQGDDLALFIARHANRGLAAIPTAPPPAAATPASTASSGPEANLGKLFGRRRKAAATPQPAASAPATAVRNATPAPTTAPRTVAVAAVSQYAIIGVEGSAEAALRELATQRLLARTNGERVATHAAACSSGHAPHAVLSGTLALRSGAQFVSDSATFELTATDCAGHIVWSQSRSADSGGAQGARVATEHAVDAAIGAYLNPPKRRRRR